MIAFACPKCRATLKAPEEKAGARLKCPKCGTALAVPADSPSPAVFAVKDEPLPTPSPPKAERRRKPVAPPPEDFDDEEDQRPRKRAEVVVVQDERRTDAPGVISLVLGSLSVACLLFGFLTFGVTYWVAVPLALLGGVLGFFGRGNMRIAGLVLNFFALVPAAILFILFTGAAGLPRIGITLEPKQPDAKAAQQAAAQARTPPAAKPPTEPPPTTPPTKDEPQWADVGKGEAWLGQVQVQVTGAGIGKVPLKDILGDSTSSDDDLLIVRLRLVNTNPTKKVEYKSWAGAGLSLGQGNAALKDNLGNAYKQVSLGLGTLPTGAVESSTALYPDKPVTDMLVFEKPLDAASSLFLELPAKNYGGEGMVRFRIPMKMVRDSASVAP